MEPMVEDATSKQKDIDFCKNGGKHEITYKINGVSVMGDVAVAHGSGHYKRTEPGGAVSIDSDYTFTDVLVKKAGGWKFQHGHIGAYMPMEETTAAPPPAEQQ
jgi:ketosteroid isomerase-like protein